MDLIGDQIEEATRNEPPDEIWDHKWGPWTATGCVFMPWVAFLCYGLRNMPRAAFLCHGLRDLPRGSCVTCHGLCDLPQAAFLCERVASSIWSPIRSMVPCGPVFRWEVRSWLPLLGPLLGPWPPVVPYFVKRFARGFLYLVLCSI